MFKKLNKFEKSALSTSFKSQINSRKWVLKKQEKSHLLAKNSSKVANLDMKRNVWRHLWDKNHKRDTKKSVVVEIMAQFNSLDLVYWQKLLFAQFNGQKLWIFIDHLFVLHGIVSSNYVHTLKYCSEYCWMDFQMNCLSTLRSLNWR